MVDTLDNGRDPSLEDLEIRLCGNPWDLEAYLAKAQILSHQGNVADAFHCIDTAILLAEYDDHNVLGEAYLLRAQLHLEDGNEDGFFEDMTFALLYAPTPEHVGQVYWEVATHFYRKEEFDKSERVFQKAASHDPKNPDFLYALICARYNQGDYLGVLFFLTDKKEVMESDDRFYRLRAHAEYNLGNIDHAINDLARARELHRLSDDDECFFASILRMEQVNAGPW